MRFGSRNRDSPAGGDSWWQAGLSALGGVRGLGNPAIDGPGQWQVSVALFARSPQRSL
jgi:hypothetical protein